MRHPSAGMFLRVSMILAVFALPPISSGGERHAGTVLGVDPGARTLMLDEFGANAVERRFEVRVADQAPVVLSERIEPVTDLRRTFRDTAIDLAGIRPADAVLIELADPTVAKSVMVTLRAGAREAR